MLQLVELGRRMRKFKNMSEAKSAVSTSVTFCCLYPWLYTQSQSLRCWDRVSYSSTYLYFRAHCLISLYYILTAVFNTCIKDKHINWWNITAYLRYDDDETCSGKTTVSVLHDAQVLLNKQQQIWGGVYIHWYFSSSTDTVVLPLRPHRMLRLLERCSNGAELTTSEQKCLI